MERAFNRYWQDEFDEAENQRQAIETTEGADANAEAGERFRIEGMDSANWALRKIAAYKAKIKDTEELAEAERFRIQQWETKEKRAAESGIAYMESLLKEYFYSERAKDAKFKISTPYGKVTARKQQPKWEYDDDQVLDFLRANGGAEYIRIKQEVNKADLKKAVEVEDDKVVMGGVTVPGIRVIEQPEMIKIETEE